MCMVYISPNQSINANSSARSNQEQPAYKMGNNQGSTSKKKFTCPRVTAKEKEDKERHTHTLR